MFCLRKPRYFACSFGEGYRPMTSICSTRTSSVSSDSVNSFFASARALNSPRFSRPTKYESATIIIICTVL